MTKKKTTKVIPVADTSGVAVADQDAEYLRCALDPIYFIETYLTVRDKVTSETVPFKLFRHQKRVIRGYERHKKNVVQKYRQGGITSVSCAYMAWLLTFHDKIKVAVVADRLNLTKKQIFKPIADLVNSVPAWMRITATESDSQEYKIYDNGAELMALAATADGLRGFSPDFLFVDEAAYLAFGEEFMSSAKGTLSVNGRIVLNSTPKGRDPVYWATYDSAINRRNSYNVVEIFWYEDPRFSKGLVWVKGTDKIENPGEGLEVEKRNAQLRKQGYKPTNQWYQEMSAEYEFDAKRIAQEIEGNFIGSGGTMIDDEHIIRIEDEQVNKKPDCDREIDPDGHYWQWDKPVRGGKYFVGVDVCYGGTDYHAVQVVKEEPDCLIQVAEFQTRIPIESLPELVYKIAVDYNHALVVVDVTGGSGATVIQGLKALGYSNYYYSEVRAKVIRDMLKSLLRRSQDGKELVPGFIIGANRKVMLELLTKMIRLNQIVIRSNRVVSEFKTFVWNEVKARYDHLRSAHDDLIMALAMILYAREYNSTGRTLTREQAMALAQSRKPVTAGDIPPDELDEEGYPIKRIPTREETMSKYQTDGPLGGRTSEPPTRGSFVLPFLSVNQHEE